jgi:hypothetical protein
MAMARRDRRGSAIVCASGFLAHTTQRRWLVDDVIGKPAKPPKPPKKKPAGFFRRVAMKSDLIDS